MRPTRLPMRSSGFVTVFRVTIFRSSPVCVTAGTTRSAPLASKFRSGNSDVKATSAWPAITASVPRNATSNRITRPSIPCFWNSPAPSATYRFEYPTLAPQVKRTGTRGLPVCATAGDCHESAAVASSGPAVAPPPSFRISRRVSFFMSDPPPAGLMGARTSFVGRHPLELRLFARRGRIAIISALQYLVFAAVTSEHRGLTSNASCLACSRTAT